MLAYIVGNGLTRKDFDIIGIKEHGLAPFPKGPIFACNAAYRDFTPDWLVAIDSKIIKEIFESQFPKEKFIVPPIEEQYEPADIPVSANVGTFDEPTIAVVPPTFFIRP